MINPSHTFYTLIDQILMRYTIEHNLKCKESREMIFTPVISKDMGDKNRDMVDRQSVVGPKYAILNMKEVISEEVTKEIIYRILQNKDNHPKLTNYSIIKALELGAISNLEKIYANKNNSGVYSEIEEENLEKEFALYTQYVEHNQNFRPAIEYKNNAIKVINQIKDCNEDSKTKDLVRVLVNNIATGFKNYSNLTRINMTAILNFLRQEKVDNNKNLYELIKSELVYIKNDQEVLNYLYVDSPKGKKARADLVLELLAKTPIDNNANLLELTNKVQSWADKYFAAEQALPIMEARLLNSQLSMGATTPDLSLLKV